ncbi:MAG: hypothetical protein NVS3B26_15420 [Mycobacteriales bacterium]
MTTAGSTGGTGRRERKHQVAAERVAAARARARRERRRRLLTVSAAVVAVIAAVALVGVGLSRTGQSDAGARVSYDARSRVLDFSLPAFSGGSVGSAQLRGKPAVVNFYASWCTVCNSEMPDFQAVHDQAGEKVAFVGVNPQSNDSDDSQAAMVKSTGVRYPTVRDRSDQLLRTFNTTGALPTTVFLDAQGQVVQVHNGGYDQQSLKAAIAQYLGVTV